MANSAVRIRFVFAHLHCQSRKTQLEYLLSYFDSELSLWTLKANNYIKKSSKRMS